MHHFPLLPFHVRVRQYLGWGPRAGRALFTNIAQLRADQADRRLLSLGLKNKDESRYLVPDSSASRHIGIFGSLGVGCTAYALYLLAQQVTRGAGYLYLDLVGDGAARKMLATAAQQGGLGFQAHVGDIGVDLDLAAAAGEGRGVYVSFPQAHLERRYIQAWVRRQLEAFIETRHAVWQAEKAAQQFFVFVPGVSFLYNADFHVLMQRARAAGVVFIFTESAMKPFDTVSDAETEALLQNTGTKVFFRLNSPATAKSAAELLAPYQSKLSEAFACPAVRLSDVLLTLGLGEAIVLAGTDVEAVRVPLVNIS
jgi:hypothetical protein